MTTATKTVAKTRTNEQTAVSVQAEISKGTLTTLAVTGTLVGLWSFASLIGGLIATGGPISMIQAWFGAVFGM